MKKFKLVFLALGVAAFISTGIFVNESSATNNGTNQYVWNTFDSSSTGWPFSDHFDAQFYGDDSSSTWKLKHFHVTNVQYVTCGGYWWRLDRVNAYDSTKPDVFQNSSHSTHQHTGVNSSYYDNVDGLYYATKTKGTVTFGLTHYMKSCTDSRTETYSGSRWRSGF